ncbi:hypothetical protein C0J52_06971 [Blattella germanica]|nr:hypothetical protein C0J52_06971 [Blattella germanica]
MQSVIFSHRQGLSLIHDIICKYFSMILYDLNHIFRVQICFERITLNIPANWRGWMAVFRTCGLIKRLLYENKRLRLVQPLSFNVSSSSMTWNRPISLNMRVSKRDELVFDYDPKLDRWKQEKSWGLSDKLLEI